MSLPHIVHICLVRQRWFFFTVLASCLAATVVVTFTLPKLYRATATLAVGQQRGITQEEALADVDEARARTYAELLRTPAVAEAVAARFHAAPEAVAQRASFEAVTGTKLVRVTASGATAPESRALANTYARVFVRLQRAHARSVAQSALDALAERVARFSERLAALRARGAPADDVRAARAEQSAALRSYSGMTDRVAAAGTDLVLASPAEEPSRPSRPQPVRYVMLGAFLSVALAVLAALVRDSFDTRIASDEELVSLIGGPVLTRIPDRADARGRRGQVEDAFQLLRLNLQMSDPGRAPRVIAIVSAGRKDGRTMVASRLAAAFATSGADVVAVDWDLREPSLHLEFGASNKVGVADFLAEPGTLVPPLTATGVPKVRLLPTGPAPQSPAQMVDQPRVRALLDGLREHADYVIMDTSPITVGADASVVAAAADAAVFVTDVSRARRDVHVAARDQLMQAGAHVVGIVLNRIREGSAVHSPPVAAPSRSNDRVPATAGHR